VMDDVEDAFDRDEDRDEVEEGTRR
jgi:hypothetical protein